MIQSILSWFSSFKLVLILVSVVSAGTLFTYGYYTGKARGTELTLVQCEAQKTLAYKTARETMIKELNTHDKRKRFTKALTDSALDLALDEWMREPSNTTVGN